MPLHDWGTTRGWSVLHTHWLVEIAKFLRPRLPAGFRVYVGTSPIIGLADPPGEPDVAVHESEAGDIGAPDDGGPAADPFQPDRELTLTTVEEDRNVYIEYGPRLVAAVELVSPGNKDRPARRTQTATRFLGYLTNGVNLLVFDPHPAPRRESLADLVAARLGLPDEPPLPPPYTISYRVGQTFGNGPARPFAVRRRRLEAGAPLPEMPVALNEHLSLMIDLEGTYMRAAQEAYLA